MLRFFKALVCFLLFGVGACDDVMATHPELLVLVFLLRFFKALVDFRVAGSK